MAQISECLGTNIRRYRRNQGMTQKELADLIEVSKETIGNIETGRKWVTTETVKKISNVLKVDQVQLFEDLNGISRVSVVQQVCKILSTVPLDILESLHEVRDWDEMREILHKITRSQDHKITRSQDHKITRSQDHKITRSQDHKITRSQMIILSNRMQKQHAFLNRQMSRWIQVNLRPVIAALSVRTSSIVIAGPTLQLLVLPTD